MIKRNNFFLFFLLITVFSLLPSGSQKVYAQMPITPTLYCVGGNGQPPCAPFGSPTGTAPSAGVSTTPGTGSTTPSGGANPSTNPTPTIDPCSSQSSVQTNNKSKKKYQQGRGGFIELFFRFIFWLIQLILGGGNIPLPNPNGPTVTPTVPTTPGPSGTSPTPCPDPTNTGPTTQPTVSTGPTAIPTTIGTSPTASLTPPVAADPSDCTTTAAETFGWGQPQYQSHFSGSTLDPTWHAYGPEPGHAKQGERTPEQITVANGNVTLTGVAGGKTAAMKWFPGQKYGRWEGCMKVSPENAYNALFLHWSDDETFSEGGGEIDWAEIFSNRGTVNYFLHCGGGGNCDTGSTGHDTTQWTAYAMEWTPTKITTYINGRVWKTSTNASQFPPRPMNWCIQLDWFGTSGTSWMSVDWTKQYAIAESVPSTLGLRPGEPATGQPDDYPQRKPRPMPIADMLP